MQLDGTLSRNADLLILRAASTDHRARIMSGLRADPRIPALRQTETEEAKVDGGEKPGLTTEEREGGSALPGG